MTTALVLGGGGITGIAWHLGLLCGLRRAGVDLGTADVIVGTSAGSVVGTLVAAGTDLEKAVALQEEEPPAGRSGRSTGGNAQWMAALSVLVDPAVPAQQGRAQVGAMALAAPNQDEDAYLARMRPLLPVRDWPERDLRLVVVDTADGRDVVLDRRSGAPLLRAVSASCAVPGLMPPVTIDGRRYMDGGIRLGAGADLATGADRLVVIAPLAVLSRDRIADEIAATGAGKTLLVEPDEATLEIFGTNFMDPTRRPASVRAGLRQGAALAEAVAAVWTD
ncbi:patatin-like phospholipase family protein [Actinoplanes sp. NPDC051851]|uniref:patatin-like phospholipase family protein n=1 Tax=Actinoplanes sp. NPDC051851 TaxID=3154753 RepID=UPI0034493FD7